MGTTRVVSATANIAEGLGFVIALAVAELEEELEEEAELEEELEAEAEAELRGPLCRRCYWPHVPAGNTAKADPRGVRSR